MHIDSLLKNLLQLIAHHNRLVKEEYHVADDDEDSIGAFFEWFDNAAEYPDERYESRFVEIQAHQTKSGRAEILEHFLSDAEIIELCNDQEYWDAEEKAMMLSDQLFY